MSYAEWIRLARQYGEARYAWNDFAAEAMKFHYQNFATVREAVDTEADEFELETLHEANGDAAWGRPENFDFTPYEVNAL
jgi:hypothetical protein